MRIITRTLAAAVLVVATTSCGNAVRTGSAPVFLVMDRLTGSRGAPTPGTASDFLVSDVLTKVTTGGDCTSAKPCLTVFDDTGSVTLRLAPKDIGTTASPTIPTSNNEVTITRIHVSYRRTDGRNTQGVDVPFAFDTFATGTVPATGTASFGFELVRIQAKRDSPLRQLVDTAQFIATICDVTVYGTDRTGNNISATGSIQVEFGDFD